MNRFVAFTAKPLGAEGADLGYAPEVELALELVGMTDIPLMAFGGLEFITTRHGLDPAMLVKPSWF